MLCCDRIGGAFGPPDWCLAFPFFYVYTPVCKIAYVWEEKKMRDRSPFFVINLSNVLVIELYSSLSSFFKDGNSYMSYYLLVITCTGHYTSNSLKSFCRICDVYFLF